MATKKLRPQFYNSNPNLKAEGVVTEFTKFQVDEYIKCSQDPIYFLENYAKIVSLDDGVVPFVPFEYQKKFIREIHENRLVVGMMSRQLGKSTICAGYIAWYILFNDNKKAAMLANKQAIAQEIFSRVKFIIENVPLWLQKGIVKWAETRIKLDNGSSCYCAATSPSAVRGDSINLILVDEFSHLNPKVADSFIASVFPTISSSKTAKMMIVSTPNGLNHFHTVWSEAINGVNGFIPIMATWRDNPNRDQAWADKELLLLGPVRYACEVECDFASSSYTLISGTKLSNTTTIKPEFVKDNLQIFTEPEEGHVYVCTVDTSEGVHQDFSAFVVFDITKMPYRVVATYKDNTISSLAYPFLIFSICKKYNDSYVLIETNSVGVTVANCIFYELEYEYVYFTHKETLNEGMGYPGVKTTKKVKAVGTACLRDLVEQDQLVINSHDILEELSVFVRKGTSYASSDPNGVNDDLTSCLWLFAWLTKQQIFSDLTDTNIRAILAKKTEEYIAENMVPLGYIVDGRNDIDMASPYELDTKKFRTLEEWVFSDLPYDDD
jgi:Terminase large subunit, T4likevirus-type, N-terminal/Terminase RNaseH-like domain